jgi:hypothetical protein
MLRVLLRSVGHIGLAVGFVTFVVDGARSIANKEWDYLSISSALETVFPRAYAGWQEAAKLHLPPVLWDPVLVRTLAAPFFVGVTVLAMLLLLLGRKPKAKIGYSNRD